MTPTASEPRPWLVFALTFAAFAYSVTHGFLWDDFAIFSGPLFAPPVTRPLTQLTFWINYKLGGSDPAGYHAVNLALHLLNVWLAWRLLGLAGVVLFALHPLQTEPVNYVWARSNLLMTTFCLLAWREWSAARSWRAVAYFACALAAKEECAAFPIALAIFDRSRRKPLAAMVGLSAAAGVYVAWVASVTAGSQAGAQSVYTPLEYFNMQALVVCRYLQLLVLPVGFAPDADFITRSYWPLWIVLAGIAAWAWRRHEAGKWFVAGLILLLPSSSVFPANDLAADRRMYLPMVAFSAALGVLLARTRWVLGIALALAFLSFQRTLLWHDPVRFWREAERSAPGKLRPKIQLARSLPPAEALHILEEAGKTSPDSALVASEQGRVLLQMGQPADALREFGRALALNPSDPLALSNRGVALLVLKQTGAARADFERALTLDPCAFEPLYNLRRMGVDTQPSERCRYTDDQRKALEELR